MRDMRPRELQSHLAAAVEPPLLLDVREPWEFEICHIAGSTLLPMQRVQAALGQLDPDRETVVICHHGIRSRQVGWYLERMGFSRVVNLSGGVDAWAREVDDAMAVY
jgi:rhodanese-related sulfurtransferase